MTSAATGSALDGSLDHHARLVRRILRVPMALVALVEGDHQLLPGAIGLPEPAQSRRDARHR